MDKDVSETSRTTNGTPEKVISKSQITEQDQPALSNARNDVQPESYLWKKFISLDGESPAYTTVVLICMSLALLIWFFERGLVDSRDDERYFSGMEHLGMDHLGVAERRLLRSLFLLVGAGLNGVIAFLLLGVNLRDLKKMPHAVSVRWLFLSVFGFIGANAAAVGVVISAEEAFEWRTKRDSYEKPFPHYMILGVFVFFMWVMDILYIRTIYLPFFELKPKGWEYIRRNIPEIIESGREENEKTTFKGRVHGLVSNLVNGFIRIVNRCMYFVFAICEEILQWWLRIYQDENSCAFLKSFSVGVSFVSLLPIRFIRSSPLVQVPLWLFKSLCWLLQKLLNCLFNPLVQFARVSRIEGYKTDASWTHRVFRGFLMFLDRFFSIYTHFKPEVQRAANELWDDIKEEEDYKHSSWLKAAVTTASILLLYFGLTMVHEFRGYMDDVYTPTRDCIVNNPGVSNFFLRFIGFAPSNATADGIEGADPFEDVCTTLFIPGTNQTTDQVQGQGLIRNLTQDGNASLEVQQNPYYEFSRQLDARVQRNLEEDRLYKCDDRVRQVNVCVLLSAVNLAEETLHNGRTDRDPSDEFFGSLTGEIVYVFDVYMRNLDWAVWVGLVVGSLFGIWTLLSVMSQYKRLSLAIRAGLFEDFAVVEKERLTSSVSKRRALLQRMDSVVDGQSFTELILHYPMSVSVLFSGMLISTAILQLVVFGGIVASVISLVAALFDSEVLSIVSPLLWTLLAFFITWLVNGPLAISVLGEGLLVSRFQVVHEICFFLFLLVFTSIHLVVGIFLAFFRMLWVLLTSLMTINRLDKNLYTVQRDRDLGHKSFMALVFMQHVFHVNRSGDEVQKIRWKDALEKMQSADLEALLHRGTLRGSGVISLSRSFRTIAEEEESPNEEVQIELGRGLFQGHEHSFRLSPRGRE